MSTIMDLHCNHRYAASVRRLRSQGRVKAEDHMVEWRDKPVSAKFLHEHDLMLPNIVKVFGNISKRIEGKTYVLNAKYTHEAFVARPATGFIEPGSSVKSEQSFFLPMDYKGEFTVVHDTERTYSVADLARILPKCVKVKSDLKNISTKAKTFRFNVGTTININGIAYCATTSGVQAFLRCSFRGNHFFTLNLDCIGEFQIVPDTQSYSLRQIESRYPTPVRVRVTEDSANHNELLDKFNTGEYILETSHKEDFLVGNCKADDSIILFSARSDVHFYVTNAVIHKERDNRFIVKHYGKEYFPIRFDFAKILGLHVDSFVATNMISDSDKLSLLNLI